MFSVILRDDNSPIATTYSKEIVKDDLTRFGLGDYIDRPIVNNWKEIDIDTPILLTDEERAISDNQVALILDNICERLARTNPYYQARP